MALLGGVGKMSRTMSQYLAENVETEKVDALRELVALRRRLEKVEEQMRADVQPHGVDFLARDAAVLQVHLSRWVQAAQHHRVAQRFEERAARAERKRTSVDDESATWCTVCQWTEGVPHECGVGRQFLCGSCAKEHAQNSCTLD